MVSRATAQIATQAVCNRRESGKGAVGEEIMSDWITLLAQKELVRRSLMISFNRAIPVFLKLLKSAIDADIRTFNAELDGNAVVATAVVDEAAARITVTCTGYDPPPRATVWFDSIDGTIRCGWDNVGQHPRHLDATLNVSASGMQINNLKPEDTATQLAQNILRPVLFPLV